MQSSAIKIGARTYVLASLDDDDFDLILAQRGVIDNTVKSFIDYDEQLIAVRNRLDTVHKRELLLHELLHACFEDSGSKQDDSSEQFISVMAPRLNVILDDVLTILGEVCIS